MNSKFNILQKLFPRQTIWWVELLGSAFIFASVYLLLYITYHAATASVAAYFGLEPILFLDKISYANNNGWYPHAVKRVFVVGAILMGVLGVVFYILYAALRKTFVFVRLFMLWASIISFGLLAQRLVGVLISFNFEFRKLGEIGFELAVFGAYMYYLPTTFSMMAFTGLLLMVAVGFFVGKPFLQSAWSSLQIGDEKSRFNYLKYQVILPYFFGMILVTLIMFPYNMISNVIAFACIGLCLVFAIVRAMLLGPVVVPRQKNWERWALVPTAMLVASILFLRVFVALGIRF